jgi:hypothetical protein
MLSFQRDSSPRQLSVNEELGMHDLPTYEDQARNERFLVLRMYPG